jgi:hypothetical protein
MVVETAATPRMQPWIDARPDGGRSLGRREFKGKMVPRAATSLTI